MLVWERGESPKQDRLAALPKKLDESVRAAGGVVTDTAIPSGKQADAWLDERLSDAAVKLDRAARARIAERLGEDRSRVVGSAARARVRVRPQRDASPSPTSSPSWARPARCRRGS